ATVLGDGMCIAYPSFNMALSSNKQSIHFLRYCRSTHIKFNASQKHFYWRICKYTPFFDKKQRNPTDKVFSVITP
ncbi:MAG: hypothetical protein ACKOUU_06015, partial [Acinetobacter tjernbergiae]